MSFCPQCGVQNPDAARFCDQCGTALVPTSSVAAAPSAPTSYTAPAVLPATSASVAPTAGALVCAQCGAAAIPGEAFCDNCGAPLNAPARAAAPVPTPPYTPSVSPQPVYPAPQPAAPPVSYSSPAASVPATPPPFSVPAAAPTAPQRTTLAPTRLVIVATGATVALPTAASVVVGRSDPVSNFAPDVDLTPHGALEQGVGRRHARLFVQSGQLMIEDLDSTNGTSVNGNKLGARQSTVLHSGDTVHFGRLAVRIQD